MAAVAEHGEEERGGRRRVKTSLVIVGFFVAGLWVGLGGLLPPGLAGGSLSFAALCVLMFFVGLSVGHDGKALAGLRSLDRRLVLLPLFTIGGTLAAVAAAGLVFRHRPLPDLLAVGSGLGYYSLSSVFITKAKGAELGMVALISNLGRELITLLAAPLLVRCFGRLAPIAAGGATTMDTTLPVITRFSGREFVLLAICHGFAVDLSVPFLVALFCSL